MQSKWFVTLAIPVVLAGCIQEDNSATNREARQTLTITEQAAIEVGIPAIRNFAEKRQLKTIYELRDTANLVTYTYYVDLGGKRHKVCPSTSVGFGIPYATQYTAPKALRWGQAVDPTNTRQGEWRVYESDQPEPNRLHMPSSADGTWVLCLHPDGKTIAPTYVEPRIVVYLFEMPAAD